MKTIRQLGMITGVTRRALQGYDEVGLLSPSSKEGQWEYDDEAVRKLMTIQIFVECGYERKEIKEILERPADEFIKEFDHALAIMKEKRKRIDGMIRMIQAFKPLANLSGSALMAFTEADVGSMFQETNFIDSLDKAIEELGEDGLNEEELEEAEPVLRMIYQVIAIGYLNGKDPASFETQTCVHELFEILEEASESGLMHDQNGTNPSKADFIRYFKDGDFLRDPEMAEIVVSNCGEGADSYVNRAIRIYCQHNCIQDS